MGDGALPLHRVRRSRCVPAHHGSRPSPVFILGAGSDVCWSFVEGGRDPPGRARAWARRGPLHAGCGRPAERLGSGPSRAAHLARALRRGRKGGPDLRLDSPACPESGPACSSATATADDDGVQRCLGQCHAPAGAGGAQTAPSPARGRPPMQRRQKAPATGPRTMGPGAADWPPSSPLPSSGSAPTHRMASICLRACGSCLAREALCPCPCDALEQCRFHHTVETRHHRRTTGSRLATAGEPSACRFFVTVAAARAQVFPAAKRRQQSLATGSSQGSAAPAADGKM